MAVEPPVEIWMVEVGILFLSLLFPFFHLLGDASLGVPKFGCDNLPSKSIDVEPIIDTHSHNNESFRSQILE